MAPPATPPVESAPVTSRRGHFWVGAEPEPDTGAARGPMFVYWEAPVEVTKPYPIVLVHGGGGQGLDYLARLTVAPVGPTLLVEQGWVVYVVDRPGHGRSPYIPKLLGPMGRRCRIEVLRGIFVPPADGPGAMPFAGLHTQWPGDRNDPNDPALLQFLACGGPFAGRCCRSSGTRAEATGRAARQDRARVRRQQLARWPGRFPRRRCAARSRRRARAGRADRPGVQHDVRAGHLAMGRRCSADDVRSAGRRRPSDSSLDAPRTTCTRRAGDWCCRTSRHASSRTSPRCRSPSSRGKRRCSGSPTGRWSSSCSRRAATPCTSICAEQGVHGNSHGSMFERNNAEVLAVVTSWMDAQLG